MAEQKETFIIDGVLDAYRPGDRIQGEVLWDLAEDYDEIVLSLGWWTSGTGTVDESVFDSLSWQKPGRIGKEPFSFTLPPGPFSFSGKLISLQWGLEFRSKKSSERGLQTFTLSPDGEEIDFSDRTYESKTKSFSFRPR